MVQLKNDEWLYFHQHGTQEIEDIHFIGKGWKCRTKGFTFRMGQSGMARDFITLLRPFFPCFWTHILGCCGRAYKNMGQETCQVLAHATIKKPHGLPFGSWRRRKAGGVVQRPENQGTNSHLPVTGCN